jgi:hypothetical protein
MQGSKLKLILPIFQVTLAQILLVWGRSMHSPVRLDTPYESTITAVCHGLNAPTIVARPFTHLVLSVFPAALPTWAHNFALDEIPFLLCVAVLWYLVAILILRNRTHKSPLILGLTLFFVVVLIFYGTQCFRFPFAWNNPTASYIEGLFSLAWATALVLIYGWWWHIRSESPRI